MLIKIRFISKMFNDQIQVMALALKYFGIIGPRNFKFTLFKLHLTCEHTPLPLHQNQLVFHDPLQAMLLLPKYNYLARKRRKSQLPFASRSLVLNFQIVITERKIQEKRLSSHEQFARASLLVSVTSSNGWYTEGDFDHFNCPCCPC